MWPTKVTDKLRIDHGGEQTSYAQQLSIYICNTLQLNEDINDAISGMADIKPCIYYNPGRELVIILH